MKNIKALTSVICITQIRVFVLSQKTTELEEHQCDTDAQAKIAYDTSPNETVFTQFGSNPSKERQKTQV